MELPVLKWYHLIYRKHMHPMGVNFCVIKKVDGVPHVLLQQRDENSPTNKLKWCFPGGAKNDFDESFLDTAIRELKEEYELEVGHENWSELLTKQPTTEGEAYGKVFVTVVDPETEVAMHEGKAYAWVSLENLSEVDFGYGHEHWIEHLITFVREEENNKEHIKEVKTFGKII